MVKRTPLTLGQRIMGGTRCAHCKEPMHRDQGWPSRHGLICPGCKSTWNTISDLCG